MISGSDERIALFIDTDADLKGVTTARAGVRGLASETKAAQAEMAASTTNAAAATGKLTVTQDQMRAALIQTNGDHIAAARLLASQAAAAEKTAVANVQVAQTEKVVAAATTEAANASLYATRAMGLQQIAALKEDAARRQSLTTVAQIPPQARTAANAVGILSQAALTGTGSLAGMATAAGGLAMSVSAMSASARIAASAAGIGALIAAGVLLAGVYKSAKAEVGATQLALDNVGRVSLTQIDQVIKQAEALRDAAGKRAAETATGTIIDLIPSSEANRAEKYYEQQIGRVDALKKKQAELVAQERIHQIESQYANAQRISQTSREIALQDVVLGKQRDARQIEFQRIQNEKTAADAAVNASFRRLDANGHVIALSAMEIKQRAQLLAQNQRISEQQHEAATQSFSDALRLADIARRGSETGAGGLGDRFQARLDQIEFERQKEIEKTQDIVGANVTAEQKKRALYRDTASAAAANAKTIVDVLLASNSKQLHAIGAFGETIRRVVIGAQAAHAAVESAIEAGKAIGSAAAGDFRGAALHGAAAVQLAAAAALGAQEALGARTAAGGSGSGAGGGGESTTFQPRDGNGAGAQVINLYTVNPYSRETIGVVRYELNRAGVLKRPIQLPPTTGLLGAT